MGIGAGTLTIIVLAVALAVVFCLSEGCERNDKTGSRVISSAIFGIIFLALIFAPRENQTIDTTTTVTDSNSNVRAFFYSDKRIHPVVSKQFMMPIVVV
jgi:hypothetical protein